MDRFFPERKIVKTGNPIRQDLIQVEQYKAQAYTHFKLNPNKKTILIIGGSLEEAFATKLATARTINGVSFKIPGKMKPAYRANATATAAIVPV